MLATGSMAERSGVLRLFFGNGERARGERTGVGEMEGGLRGRLLGVRMRTGRVPSKQDVEAAPGMLATPLPEGRG